jgi:CheY-like chemotaxis protein
MKGELWPPFRVLCVDDNRDAADSAALLLRLVGFDAKACYDGAAALKLNRTFRPAVCFIDLHMPGMDGDELAVRIRSGPGWQPVLLAAVTAMSDECSLLRIKDAGFDLHLVKPVDPQQLVGLLNRLFSAAR